MTEFEPFRKVHRLFRPVTITEKIDGTNSAIVIKTGESDPHALTTVYDLVGAHNIYAQSRKRILTLDKDNFGFAKWVNENGESLINDFGVGTHYGEWWGLGIQRGYGIDHKEFAPFNSTRWMGTEFSTPCIAPAPVLYEGLFTEAAVRDTLALLVENGSYAAPGFKEPEGIITFHRASNTMFKTTITGDDASKFELAKE